MGGEHTCGQTTFRASGRRGSKYAGVAVIHLTPEACGALQRHARREMNVHCRRTLGVRRLRSHLPRDLGVCAALGRVGG